MEVEKLEQPQEVEAEISMEDDIRATLRGLQERGEAEGIEPEVADKPEKSEPVRDDKGKFKEKEVTLPVAEVKDEPLAEPLVQAPNTWKKDVAEKWSALPAEVQSEISRREADFHKGIEQYKEKASLADEFNQAIQPYMATLQSTGLRPSQAIQSLLQSDHLLSYGTPAQKSAAVKSLADYYNLDLNQAQTEQQDPIDPNVSSLQQKVSHLENFINQKNNAEQQASEQALYSELERFKSDPAHPHYETVRNHMAALLQAQQATTLDEAYEQAVYANPTTRATLVAQQVQAAKEESSKKAQAAKQSASINVRSRGALPALDAGATMEDTIRATYRRLQGA